MKWKLAETAPKDGSNFIAWDSGFGCLLFSLHYREGDDFITDNELWSGDFSHWMPLPEPPNS